MRATGHPGTRLSIVCAAFFCIFAPSSASRYRVYIFRGGELASDNAVRQALQDRGHSPSLGIETKDFDGTQVNLGDFDVVVAISNADGTVRTTSGKTALRDYLQGGGRLVTTEYFTSSLSSD